jgi:kinesin family protein 2/24
VCVRKRPISNKELNNSEVDIVSVINPKIFVHECKIKIDGFTKYIDDQEFTFDYAFSDNHQTLDVYKCSILPNIPLIMNGGVVTCFAYGQTGSGKTFTMKGIQNYAIESLFKTVNQSEKKYQFYISFFEIYGGRLFDLLNNKNKLQVLEDKNQKIQIFGLEEMEARDSNEMGKIIELANSIRTTHNTVTNETSSRSHAICNVREFYNYNYI